jgi:sugar lactone lactonase YvrE
MTTSEVIATTPGIAEAPCAVGEELWFSDLMHGVFVVDAAGAVTSLSDRRGVGGLVPHADGGVVASGRSLVHLRRDGRHSELRGRPEGTTGFNDLLSTADGDLLAGVLTYRPLAGEPPTPGWLLRLGGHARSQLLTVGPAWPNGIGTFDGTSFYIADFSTGNVLRLLPDGQLRLLATLDEGHADGMAVDTLGRIWVATGPGATLVALTPRGAVDARIPVPSDFVASLALSPTGDAAVVAVGGMTAGGEGGLLAVDLGATGLPTALTTLAAPLPDGSPSAHPPANAS